MRHFLLLLVAIWIYGALNKVVAERAMLFEVVTGDKTL